MNYFSANILICHRCPQRQAPLAGRCLCGADGKGQDISEKSSAGECPRGYFVDGPPEREAGTESPPTRSIVTAGPWLWSTVHAAESPNEELIDGVTRALPCGECRGHWLLLLAATPPDFGEGWFAWTVRAHNLVNERLGKPPMSLASARARWHGSED